MFNTTKLVEFLETIKPNGTKIFMGQAKEEKGNIVVKESSGKIPNGQSLREFNEFRQVVPMFIYAESYTKGQKYCRHLESEINLANFNKKEELSELSVVNINSEGYIYNAIFKNKLHLFILNVNLLIKG